MWDLAEDKHSTEMIETFIAAGKTIALVCHSTAAQRPVKMTDGKLLCETTNLAASQMRRKTTSALPKSCRFLSKTRC
jgi:putative intracellular protease/amidase